MSYICIVNDKQDGCAADGGDERRLSELPFLAMFYTSMSGTRLHVYYRYLVPNEGFRLRLLMRVCEEVLTLLTAKY